MGANVEKSVCEIRLTRVEFNVTKEKKRVKNRSRARGECRQVKTTKQ